ncbi:hypothetical protein BSNK01_06950 [Bacillaceae bacterium]
MPPALYELTVNHTPGGSSSGSAAALAASMALFTLGTQTAGSLLRPAAYNGLTSIKPTYGRVSRAGIMAASWSLDHAGAFTRTVEDAAIVLGIIAGYDPSDPTTLSAPVPDYTRALDRSIQGMALGVPETFFFDDIDAELAVSIQSALDVFKALGCKIVSISLPAQFAEAIVAHRIIMQAEAASYHDDNYRRHADLFNPSLKEMIEIGYGGAHL